MKKTLLKKSALLLLSGTLLSSCVDKDYDFDNFDDSLALKDYSLGVPVGTITYSLEDLVRQANFKDSVAYSGDTIMLIYRDTLKAFSDPGNHNVKSQYIKLFTDMLELGEGGEGSHLYFSNPIFILEAANSAATTDTVYINSIKAKNVRETPALEDSAKFNNGTYQYKIAVPGGTTTYQRFDRNNGTTNKLFIIEPDSVLYDLSYFANDYNLLQTTIDAKLPMAFDKGTQIVLNDTLPVDLSDSIYSKSIDYIVIRLKYETHLPMGGDVEAVFLDSINNDVQTISHRHLKLDRAALGTATLAGIPNYTTNIASKTTSGIMYIKIEQPEIKNVSSVRAIKLISKLAAPDENILFLKNDYLKFKGDLFVKGDINPDDF